MPAALKIWTRFVSWLIVLLSIVSTENLHAQNFDQGSSLFVNNNFVVPQYSNYTNGLGTAALKKTRNSYLKPPIHFANNVLNAHKGTISFAVNLAQDSMTWTINPQFPQVSNIQIVFISLNIDIAEMRIQDSRELKSGLSLLNCIGCGNVPPPPFKSLTGSVTITIRGVPAVNFRASSFRLMYIGLSNSIIPQLNTLDINLNVGYAKITPYLYNSFLPGNSIQRWNITENSNLRTMITLSFSSFKFDDSCIASLEIYDGLALPGDKSNLIFQGCNQQDMPSRWLYAKSGRASVILRNPSSSSIKIEFQLTYTTDVSLWSCGSFSLPDIIRDTSMILTDGSKSTDFMRRGDYCEWLISPVSQATITLILRRVSVKGGGEVLVYDSDRANGYILWNGIGPTYTTPPPIVSTGKSLFITYSTNTKLSDGYYGFAGEFYSNFVGSIGMGSSNALLSMSSAIDIVPPGDGQQYTSNNSFVWYVQPATSSGPIIFVFSDINLNNKNDQLTIYDGPNLNSPVLNRYKGNTTPSKWFFTSTRQATIEFKSDQRSQSKGNFKLSYFTDGPNYHCGFTTNPALLTANSMIITDGSMSTEQQYPNADCRWIIKPRGSSLIYLFFTRFSVIGGSVSIYLGNNGPGDASSPLYVAIRDTDAVPSPMLFKATAISIVYHSGSDVAGSGFAATYFGVSSALKNSGSSTTINTSPQSVVIGPGDGIIRLHCSSMISLSNFMIADLNGSRSAINWVINPSQASGSIYFTFLNLKMGPDSGSYVSIYDGIDDSTNLIAQYNGTFLPNTENLWLRSTNTAAFVKYYSTKPLEENFELSFYSDGSNSHCGFAVNPARLESSSMIFTDGSSSTGRLTGNEDCQWIIDPGPSSKTLVLEFLESDLVGGSIEVYDGSLPVSSSLLWLCDGCTVRPNPIISKSGKLFVWYRSASISAGTSGKGFRAFYWTITIDETSWRPQMGPHSLDMPIGMAMDNSIQNRTSVWKLGNTKSLSKLVFSPRILYNKQQPQHQQSLAGIFGQDINDFVRDGRWSDVGLWPPTVDGSTWQDSKSDKQGYTCGTIRSDDASVLLDESVTMQATQRVSSYLFSESLTKRKQIIDLSGAWDTSISNNLTETGALFSPSRICKYYLDSGSSNSILISFDKFQAGASRLRVYSGLYGYDRLDIDTSYSATYPVRSIVAPCGRAIIVLEHNDTIGPDIDYGMEMNYRIIDGDNGWDCLTYIESLKPKIIYVNPYIPYYIGFGVTFFVLWLGLCIYFFRKRYPHWSCKSFRPKLYQRVTPNYPAYSPRLDAWRNKMLPRGNCCVCSESNTKIFRLSCRHCLCIEDVKSYLETALGDISMFPVKCPMHFEGCTGIIDAHITKRVVSRIDYMKFIEFSDRAIYGEGMRCIFCNNFVNFPSDSRLAMVECPYCIQRFCFRCKKPWHYGAKCPLESVDDELESWKKTSGAQKCPSCQKLIEKDDPNTCHHMVHKITDGIPCIRDRTDFCYLCGEEVLPDYPHDEVKNSGVNHFPDGVFQKCRYVSAKEREAERERIKRLRRLKNRNSITPVSSDIDNFDSTWDDALVSVSRPGPGQESTPNSAGQRSLSTFAHPRGFVVGFDDSFATLTNLSSRTRTSIVQSANSASTVDSSATSSPSPSLRGNNTGLGLNIPVPQTANAAAGPATPVSSSPQTPGNRRSMLTPPQDHSSPLNRQNNGDNTQQRPRAMTNVPQSQSPSPSTPGAVMIQQQSPTPMRQPLRAQAARSRIGVTSTAHSIPGQQSRR